MIDNLTAVGSKVSGVAASIASCRQVRDQVMSGLVQRKLPARLVATRVGTPGPASRRHPSQLARSSMSPVIRDEH